ncbi:dihydrofolate reductase family protein [Williamsia soli]|uniref:dihydrofolate reductase family protein n=1 Tax=Williamsia soli TaxID=364929 RepID=UPI001A9EB496|nr:dihydrofolate reductase family protein [Williamsia soli]
MTTTPIPAVTGAVFIATSLDGYIARTDGDIDWLLSRSQDIGETGYDAFIETTGAIVMGRNTYEIGTTFDEWPYTGLRVMVLSTQLDTDVDDRVTVHRTIDELLVAAAAEDIHHVYADGGRLITSFLQRGLITELTITTIPVILGSGLPLFGVIDHDVSLELLRSTTLGQGITQSVYRVTD